MTENDNPNLSVNGDGLLAAFTALASPHRLRILALLSVAGRTHVSQLARDLGMSRPLLYLHLQRLEAGGLVKGELELSADGKALKYFEVAPFDLRLTPGLIAQAVESLSPSQKEEER